VYTIYSILFIVFLILIIVTAFITVALTYFQLAVEVRHGASSSGRGGAGRIPRGTDAHGCGSSRPSRRPPAFPSPQDHRWWWRSFLCGGSTAFFVLGYCFFYYHFRWAAGPPAAAPPGPHRAPPQGAPAPADALASSSSAGPPPPPPPPPTPPPPHPTRRSDMSGFMQTMFFFGYNAITCYAFFLMLGTVGWWSSHVFVFRIFQAVKARRGGGRGQGAGGRARPSDGAARRRRDGESAQGALQRPRTGNGSPIPSPPPASSNAPARRSNEAPPPRLHSTSVSLRGPSCHALCLAPRCLPRRCPACFSLPCPTRPPDPGPAQRNCNQPPAS
jgi:hypothetical protein